MVWRVFHSAIHMAREVSSRDAMCITLRRENRRDIILKIGCVTYPNTPEGHRAYRETLPAERSKPRISIPTAHAKVWYVGEYEKKACRIILKTNTEENTL
tara:strand:- start:442 stop:741 length:300 start_codon:yes stop_codon:yes gene_type:complete